LNAENKLKEAAKLKSDTEDMLKSKKNNKKTLMVHQCFLKQPG
jgi:hypothetical protein